MTKHSELTLDNLHGIVSFRYDTLVARQNASGFVLSDLGKVAWQLEDNTFYILTNIDPIEWEDFSVKTADMADVELHSYELIKELTLNNQTFDFTLDVSQYDDLKIVSDYKPVTAGTSGYIGLQINNISTSDYSYVLMYTGGVTPSVGEGTLTYASIGQWNQNNTVFSKNISDVTLNRVKTVGRRYVQSIGSYYGGGGTDSSMAIITHSLPSVTSVNTIRLFAVNPLVGNIRVYAPVKTSLISSDPGKLSGMWQKSIDGNTIEIQPGCLEIASVICHQTTALQITLSGNLRTGETETADTIYYLYAVKGANNSLTYKFSSTAPLLDRYGNTIGSFENCDPTQDWYHPTEGNTWRYIGQVYNLPSGDILGFSKCSVSRWEGAWTAIPSSRSSNLIGLSHGFGKASFDYTFRFKKALADTQIYNTYTYSDNISVGACPLGAVNNKGLSALFGVSGVFYDNTAWVNTGYYKLIIT